MHSLKPLKIGYFADGIWAHNAFKKLIASQRFQICFITPRFDSTDGTLLDFATRYHIPYIKSKNINSPEFMEQIRDFECDIFVSMSFNQIFKEPLISLPRLQSINCHAGKLPFYRGRNILNWALINDEKEFGISVHYIDSGIDTGDIILQRTYPIQESDDYSSLLHTAHTQCAEVLFDALCLLQEGKAQRIKQESIHKVGSYCPARIAGDEWIDWQRPSREVFNFIRALNAPSLGAKTRTSSQEMRIFKSQMIESAPLYRATPGCIVGIESLSVSSISHNQVALIVKTLDSTLRLVQYQYERENVPLKLKIGDRFLTTPPLLGGGGGVSPASYRIALFCAMLLCLIPYRPTTLRIYFAQRLPIISIIQAVIIHKAGA